MEYDPPCPSRVDVSAIDRALRSDSKSQYENNVSGVRRLHLKCCSKQAPAPKKARVSPRFCVLSARLPTAHPPWAATLGSHPGQPKVTPDDVLKIISIFWPFGLFYSE
mgnify:FL=1